MSTDSVSPLRQRMIEDMNARKLCAGTQRATSAAANNSPRFSNGRLTWLQRRTSASFSCIFRRPA